MAKVSKKKRLISSDELERLVTKPILDKLEYFKGIPTQSLEEIQNTQEDLVERLKGLSDTLKEEVAHAITETTGRGTSDQLDEVEANSEELLDKVEEAEESDKADADAAEKLADDLEEQQEEESEERAKSDKQVFSNFINIKKGLSSVGSSLKSMSAKFIKGVADGLNPFRILFKKGGEIDFKDTMALLAVTSLLSGIDSYVADAKGKIQNAIDLIKNIPNVVSDYWNYGVSWMSNYFSGMMSNIKNWFIEVKNGFFQALYNLGGRMDKDIGIGDWTWNPGKALQGAVAGNIHHKTEREQADEAGQSKGADVGLARLSTIRTDLEQKGSLSDEDVAALWESYQALNAEQKKYYSDNGREFENTQDDMLRYLEKSQRIEGFSAEPYITSQSASVVTPEIPMSPSDISQAASVASEPSIPVPAGITEVPDANQEEVSASVQQIPVESSGVMASIQSGAGSTVEEQMAILRSTPTAIKAPTQFISVSSVDAATYNLNTISTTT